MNEQTIQSMKELIAKQTICTDAVVDKFNELAKKWEAREDQPQNSPKQQMIVMFVNCQKTATIFLFSKSI